ncbi:hypothetical protein SDJN03_16671, partial [Cucurbita argyrosperma subsp. sororia]
MTLPKATKHGGGRLCGEDWGLLRGAQQHSMHPPTPLRQQPTVVMAADGQCPTWVSAALTNEDTCLDGFKEVDGDVQLGAP